MTKETMNIIRYTIIQEFFQEFSILKIPEYLPSRKTEDTDGAISFVGTESKTDGIMTNSTLQFLQK